MNKYYTEDGKEWTGPKHQMPDGSWMTENPHNEKSVKLKQSDLKKGNESWFNTLKQSGPVTTANSTPGLMNNKVVMGGKPKNKHEKKDEENEQLIIPREQDFFRGE